MRAAGRKIDLPNVASDFDKIRNDYDMSRENRFIRRRTGLAPRGGSADYHYRSEELYYRDIEKSRDMERNDAIVGHTTGQATANIVQDGFTLDPRTGDLVLDDELYYRWIEFSENAKNCDIAGEYVFHDYEMHACHSMHRDGDCAIIGTETGHLQFVEAHVIQTVTTTPNCFLGVEKDEFGKRIRYHFVEEGEYPSFSKKQAEPIDVYNGDGFRQLFHVYNSQRMTQTRGVTAYAPIFALAGMFEDINFAKLVQQQITSCFAIFRKKTAVQAGPNINRGYGASQTETTASGTRYLENIAPGMEIIGEPGEELQGFSPNVPNSEYFTHVKLMLQLIGVNLGLPLCLVLMDGSETNFSGWRGAVDEARKGFRANQRNLIKRFHTPCYRLKVWQWMQEDPALRAVARLSGIDVYGHKWNAPRWAYIDPVGDAQGDMLRLQNGLTSPRRLHAERGAEWQEVADEIVEDMAYAISKAKNAAVRINNTIDDGQPVHWRELISLPMPTGLQMTMQDPKLLSLQEREQQEAANVKPA